MPVWPDFSGWRVCGGAGESGAGSQLNVMMFSDNVTLEDEIQLKTAREKKACW